MHLIDSFYDNIGNNVDAAQSWMEAWKDKAAAMGYDLWKNDEEKTTTQSGRAGAFQTLTQDQGTKLEGLMTSLQTVSYTHLNQEKGCHQPVKVHPDRTCSPKL